MANNCAFITFAAVVTIALSYFLAKIGEPQSAWFWCSLFKVCP